MRANSGVRILYVSLLLSWVMTACSTFPAVQRAPAAQARPLTEITALEAIGLMAEGMLLDKEQERIVLRSHLVDNQPFTAVIDPFAIMACLFPIMSSTGGGIYLQLSAHQTRTFSEKNSALKYALDRLFSGNNILLGYGIASSATVTVSSGYTSLTPIDPDKQALNLSSGPVNLLQYVFFRPSVRNVVSRHRLEVDQVVKAKFMASIKEVARTLAGRAGLLLRLSPLDQAELQIRFQRDLQNGFDSDDVWTRSSPVKIDVTKILTRIDSDITDRLAAVRELSIRAGSVDTNTEGNRDGYDRLMNQIDQLESAATASNRLNAHATDPDHQHWAAQVLKYAVDLRRFRERLELRQGFSEESGEIK